MNWDKTKMVAGYECPHGTTTTTKAGLKKLRKDGILIFDHDDSELVTVHQELKEIAGAVSIYIAEDSQYRLILIADSMMKSWKPRPH